MIGLDTNVLVRYIMQDDPLQSAKATQLLESLDANNLGFVALASILELYWVLTASYKLSRAQAAQALDALLHTRQIQVEQADRVIHALRAHATGQGDFADCLIERSAAAAGCTHTLTFYVKAAQHAGMKLIA